MFSNTAYEAMYEYIGLELHSKFIEVITSQKVFLGVVLLTFGVTFFLTTMHFFSRYLPGTLVRRKTVPLSQYAKIIGCLFLGTALLKVGSTTGVSRYNGESWHDNPYIHGQVRGVSPEYRVSFVFDVLSRSAEEVSALISRVIDGLFKTTNSQMEAPNFFFKAIMYAGSATLEDPSLKRVINFYTEECFDRLVAMPRGGDEKGMFENFLKSNAYADQKLSEMVIETPEKTMLTCLDVKTELTDRLKQYAATKLTDKDLPVSAYMNSNVLSPEQFKNLFASNLLANNFVESHESAMGLQEGAMLPTTGGRIFQYLNRAFSWDGLLSMVGGKELQGAVSAAKRSQEFSENLARAPHLAGFIKMTLIALFPWLIFLVVAGKWRVLVSWYMVYFSVLLWTPLWTLLYHVMTGITLSADMMSNLARFHDGVSLYSAQIVSDRIYHMFEVYAWLQILIGTLFTGSILFFLRPLLTDGGGESSPDFIDDSSSAASKGSGLVSAGKKAVGALV